MEWSRPNPGNFPVFAWRDRGKPGKTIIKIAVVELSTCRIGDWKFTATPDNSVACYAPTATRDGCEYKQKSQCEKQSSTGESPFSNHVRQRKSYSKYAFLTVFRANKPELLIDLILENTCTICCDNYHRRWLMVTMLPPKVRPKLSVLWNAMAGFSRKLHVTAARACCSTKANETPRTLSF
jgi:hypothetical protein